VSAVAAAPTGVPASPGGREQARRARRLRGDLRFLSIYVHTIRRVMRYRPHPEALAAGNDPAEFVGRIEDGLAGEASRYRQMGWSILAVLVAPLALGAFLWSGMYWLPIRIYWWPFERGNYGLPFLSLFEWLSYLAIAAYFVVTGALLATSHDQTKRLGTEYRRLLDTPAENREAIVAAIGDGAHPRTRFVVERSPVFADFAELLARRDAE
jgi:hypothetical protein